MPRRVPCSSPLSRSARRATSRSRRLPPADLRASELCASSSCAVCQCPFRSVPFRQRHCARARQADVCSGHEIRGAKWHRASPPVSRAGVARCCRQAPIIYVPTPTATPTAPNARGARAIRCARAVRRKVERAGRVPVYQSACHCAGESSRLRDASGQQPAAASAARIISARARASALLEAPTEHRHSNNNVRIRRERSGEGRVPSRVQYEYSYVR